MLLREVLAAFEPVPLRALVDGTLGAGGHSAALLAAHPEARVLVGVDRDPAAHALAAPRLRHAAAEAGAAGRLDLKLVRGNFADLRDAVPPELHGKVDGVLLDLGVSSMQLDVASRGFSFGADGPCDMRMEGPESTGADARVLVNEWPEDELARVFREYGEERHARLFARRICDARLERRIETTRDLVSAIGRAPGGQQKRRDGKRPIHPATRVFQALRIAVNDELGAVERAIPTAIDLLAPGGRLAVISFHSLEDRIVKNAMREAAGHVKAPEGPISPLAIPEPPSKVARLVTKKPVVPTAEEEEANTRSRSAKLRVLEKL